MIYRLHRVLMKEVVEGEKPENVEQEGEKDAGQGGKDAGHEEGAAK